MQSLWSDLARGIAPYVPGEQPQDRQYIKLNTNENPYPPSPKALEAVCAAADADLRLYPDPEARHMREAVAEVYGVTPEQVFVGNGSDEVLAIAFQAFFSRGSTILFPDVTYSFYPVYASLYGIGYETVPLREDFSICVEDYMRPCGGVIFPNPNAPTGRTVAQSDLCALLENKKDTPVIIDEAYTAFAGESMVSYIARYPQLVVVFTLSKSHSLAGLRGGYAIAHPSMIEAMERIKNSFNSYTLDRLALRGAAAALRDTAYTKDVCEKIVSTRTWFAKALEERGFFVVPSQANFIFARHDAHDGAKLFKAWRESGVLVRHFSQPRTAQYLRITIGTDEQMREALARLDAILSDGSV